MDAVRRLEDELRRARARVVLPHLRQFVADELELPGVASGMDVLSVHAQGVWGADSSHVQLAQRRVLAHQLALTVTVAHGMATLQVVEEYVPLERARSSYATRQTYLRFEREGGLPPPHVDAVVGAAGQHIDRDALSIVRQFVEGPPRRGPGPVYRIGDSYGDEDAVTLVDEAAPPELVTGAYKLGRLLGFDGGRAERDAKRLVWSLQEWWRGGTELAPSPAYLAPENEVGTVHNE
jgi:hypothetical protein